MVNFCVPVLVSSWALVIKRYQDLVPAEKLMRVSDRRWQARAGRAMHSGRLAFGD